MKKLLLCFAFLPFMAACTLDTDDYNYDYNYNPRPWHHRPHFNHHHHHNRQELPPHFVPAERGRTVIIHEEDNRMPGSINHHHGRGWKRF